MFWKDSLLILLWIGALIALAFFVRYLWRHPGGRIKSKEKTAKPLVLTRNAVSRQKDVQMMGTGTSKMPEHHMRYQVLFQFDDGSEEWVQMLPEYFEQIPIGVRGKLTTEDGEFLDFDGMFGKNIDESPEIE